MLQKPAIAGKSKRVKGPLLHPFFCDAC